jgi:3-deoxy-manno-octulosonate cytidylyltransferase (CMP-KDO synthetase)
VSVLGIIPARFDAARFPGKPLVNIAGKPMIQHVFERALQSQSLDKLVVATDNEQIFATVQSFGGEVYMTDPNCNNGTERCANLLQQLNQNFDCIINIQGDEPILHPEQIDQLALLLVTNTDIATLAHPLLPEENDNKNIVKVALDNNDIALGFSRDYDFIQHLSDKIYKHIGLYGFKTNVLTKIVKLQPSPNEVFEKLEQLRWLDHGYKIKVGITKHRNFSVDVPADIEKILEAMQQNPL